MTTQSAGFAPSSASAGVAGAFLSLAALTGVAASGSTQVETIRVEVRRLVTADSPLIEWDPFAPTRTAAAPTEVSASTLLNQVHERSGLTWDQIARLFGVSRRAVHQWAAGGRLSSANREHLAEIVATINAMPETTPEQRSQALFVRTGGTSLFDSLLRKRSEAPVIQPAAVSARSLLEG